MPANYCILSIGQVMRAPTKKLPGSLLPNSDMLLNSLWISTLHIQPSLVLFQLFDPGTFHFNLKSYLKFHTFYKSNQFSLLFYSLSGIPIPFTSLPALDFLFQVTILLLEELPDLHQGRGNFLFPPPSPSLLRLCI